MLWKGFYLPWRGFSDHPPLLSSVDVQAFLCCWAHQWILFFSECTKLLYWPLWMFLLSLWWIFLFLKPNNCLFHLYGEILLTAWCGFTAKASKCKCYTYNQLQNFENSRTLLNWCRDNKRIAYICPWKSFWVNCPITSLEKGGRYIFNFNVDENTLKWMPKVCTLSICSLYNCNLNMFW